MTQHTPGPWAVRRAWSNGEPCDMLVVQSGVTPIADVVGDANARLIAAAPEMLEALHRVLDVITGDQAAELGVYDAITKATGDTRS